MQLNYVLVLKVIFHRNLKCMYIYIYVQVLVNNECQVKWFQTCLIFVFFV